MLSEWLVCDCKTLQLWCCRQAGMLQRWMLTNPPLPFQQCRKESKKYDFQRMCLDPVMVSFEVFEK